MGRWDRSSDNSNKGPLEFEDEHASSTISNEEVVDPLVVLELSREDVL
jgi:hypothetical protein